MLNDSAKQFAGRWSVTQMGILCDCTFRADGTFIAQLSRGKKVFSRPTGRWYVQDEHLVFEYLDDEFGEIGPHTDYDKIAEVTKEYFIISTSTGVRKYQRIL